MQLITTINSHDTYEINYGVDEDGDIELDRVMVYDMDGEEIEPDFFDEDDWTTIEQLCKEDYLGAQIDHAMSLRWD